jgi:hypothetical protein
MVDEPAFPRVQTYHRFVDIGLKICPLELPKREG